MIGEKGVQFKFGGGSKIKNNVYYMIPVLNKKKINVLKNLRLYTARGYSRSLLLWQDH